MSSDGVVRLEHVWKRFRSDRAHGQLRDEFRRLRSRVRGDGQDGWRWALRDVSVRLDPGESVGLIGVNGSGKTTLLRIASGVMNPYAGVVDVRGRISGLIDVLAGIHPELSGRENIFLYGALLGMPRQEVARRFDDVVAFAEIAHALDRQVKFYSSGMRLRLGFAVAAHLEPDVLLVDEVLAVGDASFQQRCLGRIQDLIDGGTTVLFVSHDLDAVLATCNRVIWLDDGAVRADGPSRAVLSEYRATFGPDVGPPRARGGLTVSPVTVRGFESSIAETGGPVEVSFDIDVGVGDRRIHVFVGITEGESTAVLLARRDVTLQAATTVRCRFESVPLAEGSYGIWLGIMDSGARDTLVPWQHVADLAVIGSALEATPASIVRRAPIVVPVEWDDGSGSRTEPWAPRQRRGAGQRVQHASDDVADGRQHDHHVEHG